MSAEVNGFNATKEIQPMPMPILLGRDKDVKGQQYIPPEKRVTIW